MTDTCETASNADAVRFGKSMLESATQMWLAGLGALWLAPIVKAQDEGAKILDLLARLQQRAAPKATEPAPENAGSASATWDRLEQVFDERVAHALTRLNVPTQSDVDALRDQLAALTAAVNELTRQRTPTTRSRPIKTQS